MTDNAQDRLIPLELTRTDLHWLRGFLNAGRISADHDYKNVEALRNDLAIRAAQDVLRSEHARMTKIVEAISEKLCAIDKHESRARQIDAMTPPAA